MLRQDDNMMPDAIKRWGCYFMSVLWHCEQKRGKPFYADEIISIYRACMTTGVIGWMDENDKFHSGERFDKDGHLIDGCYVIDPISLFQVAGVRVNTITKMDAKYKAGKGEIEILCFHRPKNTPSGMNNSEHTHFIPSREWDPLGQSNTVKYGYLKSKRIFK